MNECVLGTHACDMNANCLNTNGSFTCSCKTGYFGTGFIFNCTGKKLFCFILSIKSKMSKIRKDINECMTNNGGCDMKATCTNTPGSYSCTCNTGYSGNGYTCTGKNIFTFKK